MQFLPVLMPIHFVKPLKSWAENVSIAFGDTITMLPKLNASKLFVLPNTFQTIMENAPESVIFVIYSMHEEHVWPVFQHTLFN